MVDLAGTAPGRERANGAGPHPATQPPSVLDGVASVGAAVVLLGLDDVRFV
jgi:hypothetical protein